MDWETIQREREWRSTELGKLFTRFENTHAAMWREDNNDSLSMQRHRKLEDDCNTARKALLLAIRGW